MTRAPSFAAVILAAGASSRMGCDKALLTWQGKTFLAAHIQALDLHADFVLVVAGANADVIRPLVYAAGADLVVNPAPEQGQFSSLRVGLREVLNRGRDAALIALVDRPPAASATIAKLKQGFVDAVQRDKWAAVPSVNGMHGHPIVAGREMIEAFLRAPASSTARDVEHEHQARIEYMEVADPFITLNVDTPAEYERLTHGETKA